MGNSRPEARSGRTPRHRRRPHPTYNAAGGFRAQGAQFRHPQSMPHQGGAQNACRIRTPGVSTCRRDLRYRSRAIGHRRSLFRNKGRRPRRIRVVESLHQGRNSVRYRGGVADTSRRTGPLLPKEDGEYRVGRSAIRGARRMNLPPAGLSGGQKLPSGRSRTPLVGFPARHAMVGRGVVIFRPDAAYDGSPPRWLAGEKWVIAARGQRVGHVDDAATWGEIATRTSPQKR